MSLQTLPSHLPPVAQRLGRPLTKAQHELSLFQATNLIKVLSDRGSLTDACRVFDEMPERDVVTWTALISAYASNGRAGDAWATYREMVAAGVRPNAYTVSSLLKACKDTGWGPPGSAAPAVAHAVAVRRGVDRSVHVENALLDAYAARGAAASNARELFDGMAERTAVSWTTMIAAYTRMGDGMTAVWLFRQMIQEGSESSPFTSSIAIRACSSIGNLTLGRHLHANTVKTGHETSIPVANSLVDMYSRCMSLLEAKQYFREMPHRDVITWNTMIAALERSSSAEALQLLIEMGSQSIEPNCFTFTSIISACANLAGLSCGRQVHGAVLRRGFGENQQVANALINMYTKCGSVAHSKRIFSEMKHRDLVSWTSMMVCYGTNGRGKDAIELFDKMIGVGVQPDAVVFMGLISACSHAGLVEEGLRYFDSMSTEYNVRPNKEVYGCAVDLLGRAGRVAEAYELIETMPFEPDESIWGALLGACKMHRNVELGRLAARKMSELKPTRAKTYVILSNIYASEGEWEEFAEVRRLLRGIGGRTEVGWSWIEVGNGVRSFVAGDRSNPCVGLAYGVLEMLVHHMVEEAHAEFCSFARAYEGST